MRFVIYCKNESPESPRAIRSYKGHEDYKQVLRSYPLLREDRNRYDLTGILLHLKKAGVLVNFILCVAVR